jgi:hypothetical protein
MRKNIFREKKINLGRGKILAKLLGLGIFDGLKPIDFLHPNKLISSTGDLYTWHC